MKVAVVDTYYVDFLLDFYRTHAVHRLSYDAHRARLLDIHLGTSDYYARNLAPLGIEAVELIGNSVPLQLAWAREHDASPWRHVPRRLSCTNLVMRAVAQSGALSSILVEQIRAMKPDVVYLQDLWILPPQLLRALKPAVRLIVGQCGSAPPPDDRLRPLDLVLTSFPHFVARFRDRGIPAEYFKLGFDPRVLDVTGPQSKRYDCSFVGGISPAHASNLAFLEHMARHAQVDFFGYGIERLEATSPIRARHHGSAWALDMYRTLARSRITLNRHGAIAEDQANNMRLFEATGMGAMLITDAKANLGELFEVGAEVVAYRSPEEAAEQVRYFTEHPAERDAIALAGQRRTLRDHTYARRMEELAAILRTRLP